MKKVISIPNVTRDDRIGSAFNHLFALIQEIDNCNESSITWDFKNTQFFHPFFLAPLIIYKKSCEKDISCDNVPSYIKNYFDLVYFDEPLTIENEQKLTESLQHYLTRTYLPVCRFTLKKENIDALQSIIEKIIRKQCNADSRMVSPLSLFFSELIDNMNEHSEGNYGYIFSQYLKREKCIDIVLADDGITIYGSYVKTKKYLELIQNNEAESLKLAIEGKSTKNRPEVENRGYGLSSSKSMLVDGLKGAFFILSGGAFHRHDASNCTSIKLPDTICWKGTIILMRIPTEVPEDFDYYKYIH